jgi:hypothetical protein
VTSGQTCPRCINVEKEYILLQGRERQMAQGREDEVVEEIGCLRGENERTRRQANHPQGVLKPEACAASDGSREIKTTL